MSKGSKASNKDNGRFATVPMRRLSADDRHYVEETLASLEGQAGKFISAKLEDGHILLKPLIDVTNGAVSISATDWPVCTS